MRRQIENGSSSQNQIENFLLSFHRREYIMLELALILNRSPNGHNGVYLSRCEMVGERLTSPCGASAASSARSFSMIAALPPSSPCFFICSFLCDSSPQT